MSEQTQQLRLAFGYNDAIPAGTPTAWGARLIISNGYADLLHDRQDTFGDRAEVRRLLDHINAVKPLKALDEMLKTRQVRPDVAGDVVIFDDGVVRMVGNTHASHGYMYVAVWFL